MCDYSLYGFKSRAAKIGDKLITGRIQGENAVHLSMTKGLYEEGDRQTAICLLPGTELAFAEEPVRFFGIPLFQRSSVAKFVQIDVDNLITHHDALEFPDGSVRLINDLSDGQRLRVLQLPALPRTVEEATSQKRVAIKA